MKLKPEKLNRLEFHRHGLALIPEPADRYPGIAVFSSSNDKESSVLLCTCKRGDTCRHQKELITLRGLLISTPHDNLNYNVFLNSIWYKIARIMADDSNNTIDVSEIRVAESDQDKELIIEDQRLNRILT